jgi:hypothetical protein
MTASEFSNENDAIFFSGVVIGVVVAGIAILVGFMFALAAGWV